MQKLKQKLISSKKTNCADQNNNRNLSADGTCYDLIARIHFQHAQNNSYSTAPSLSPSSCSNTARQSPSCSISPSVAAGSLELSRNSSFCSVAPFVPVKSIPYRSSSLATLDKSQSDPNCSNVSGNGGDKEKDCLDDITPYSLVHTSRPKQRRYFRPSLGILQDFTQSLCRGLRGIDTPAEQYLYQIYTDIPRIMKRLAHEVPGYEMMTFNEFLNLRKELDMLLLRNHQLESQLSMAKSNSIGKDLSDHYYLIKCNMDRINQCYRMIAEHVSAILFYQLHLQKSLKSPAAASLEPPQQVLPSSISKPETPVDTGEEANVRPEEVQAELEKDNYRLREKLRLLSEELEQRKTKHQSEVEDVEAKLRISDDSLSELVKIIVERDVELKQTREKLELERTERHLVIEKLRVELKQSISKTHLMEQELDRAREEFEAQYHRHVVETEKLIHNFNRDLDALQRQYDNTVSDFQLKCQ